MYPSFSIGLPEEMPISRLHAPTKANIPPPSLFSNRRAWPGYLMINQQEG